MSTAVQGFAPKSGGGIRAYGRFWVTLLVILLADQASKACVLKYIAANTYFEPEPIPVIPNFFYLVNVSNSGAAWGIFSKYTLWLACLGVAALGAIYFFRQQLELSKPLLQYTFGLLCGGIIGNLIDRLTTGHVVDFLDFHLPGYRYPAFNVADSGITVGVTIYLLYSFRDWWPARRPAVPPTRPGPNASVEIPSTTSSDSANKSAAN
jgi:signal peptidase II